MRNIDRFINGEVLPRVTVLCTITCAYIMLAVRSVVRVLATAAMSIPDKWLSFVKPVSTSPVTNAVLDGHDFTNRMNLLLWIYWDDAIPGISINNIAIQGNQLTLLCGPRCDLRIDVNLRTRRYLDGNSIPFNELRLES